MSNVSKWMNRLNKLSGAVQRDYNPFLHVIQCPSPSVNFIFGNTHGMPEGYSMVLYGPPRGGKTVLCNSYTGWIHQSDPEAFVIKFDTEARELGQMTDLHLKNYGIDPDRYVVYETNRPDEIFDRIEKEIAANCQEGMKLKLIIIDSITGVVGRRSMNADSIMTQQIGDDAKTVQDGLKRILPIIRRNKICLILTSQLRAELDPKEVMRGNTTKMAGAFAMKHFAEFHVYVEPNKSKDGRQTLDGKEFVNDALTDMMDHSEKTGHKVRVFMKDSSVGPKGRVGEFTFDYYKGIINTYEEVFLLGIRRGILEHAKTSYILKDYPKVGEESRWVGKPATLVAVRDNALIYNEILKRVRAQDAEAMTTGQMPQPDVATVEDETPEP